MFGFKHFSEDKVKQIDFIAYWECFTCVWRLKEELTTWQFNPNFYKQPKYKKLLFFSLDFSHTFILSKYYLLSLYFLLFYFDFFFIFYDDLASPTSRLLVFKEKCCKVSANVYVIYHNIWQN